MNPIKRKVIAMQTAKEMGLPLELVDDIVSFYYKNVQNKLATLSNINMNVPNLGTFILKEKSVIRKLDKYENAIIRLEEQIEADKFVSLQKYASIVSMKDSVLNFENALSEMKKEKISREEKQKEKESYAKHKPNQTLENERKDLGRDQE